MLKYQSRCVQFKQLICLLTGLLIATSGLAEEHVSPINVLYISSFHPDLEYTDLFEKGLHKSLSDGGTNFNIYKEYLDSRRFPDPEQKTAFAEYLQIKYRNIAITAIISVSGTAEEFIEKHPNIVSNNTEPPINISAGSLRVINDKTIEELSWDFRIHVEHSRAVDELLKIYAADTLYVVGDIIDSDSEERIETFRQQIKQSNPNVKIEYLINRPLPELLTIVSNLPQNSAIYYLLSFRDEQGHRISGTEAAKKLVQHANVPIFSHWDSLMTSGILGGYQISWQKIAAQSGGLIKGHVNNETDQIEHMEPFVTNINWLEMQRWDIDPSLLPADTIFLNQPPSIIIRYRLHIMFGSMAFMIIYIILFLVYRNRMIDKRNHILDELTKIDGLTKLLNRRAIMPLVNDEMHRRNEFDRPASILILDLDKFKRINDDLGHLVGDEVLIEVANKLHESIRSSDRLARWGGEEFLILTSDTTLKQAELLGEKIRKVIYGLDVHQIKGISISIGVAEYRSGENFGSWYERADKALYQAKDQGRNNVVALAA